MKDLNRSLILIIAILAFVLTCFASTSSITLKTGRTDPQCDFNSPGKTLIMFGASYERWYKEFVSLGIHPYVSQMQGGGFNETVLAEDGITRIPANFRTYVFGADVQLRLRPTWKYLNIKLNEGPNPKLWQLYRIAPYAHVGVGGVLFNPEKRNGGEIQGDFAKENFVAPVYGGGLTFFWSPGYNLDLGYEEHKVNSDYLDGVKLDGNDDYFGTYYLGLTIAYGAKPVEVPAPVVVETPKPAPVVPKPEVKPVPVVVPKPVPVEVPKPVVVVETPKIVEPIAPPPAPVVEKEIPVFTEKTISFKGVNFKTNSAELLPAAKDTLDLRVYSALIDYPELTLEIQGHTDSDGTDISNQGLSERRAASVKAYLVSKGIAASRLTTIGYGESQPKSTNATPIGKATNRRIEFRRTDK